VRSALEYTRGGDLAKAHAASNPDLAPRLSFVDGHGRAAVRVDTDTMATNFVCIPRPVERSAREMPHHCAIACAMKWRPGARGTAADAAGRDRSDIGLAA
jgi:alkaline phosphatase D